MAKKELIAIDPMNHDTRIVFDHNVETFFLQEKIFWIWTTSRYTFDVREMKQWRDTNRLAWVAKRFKDSV